mmetsp:Transcript_31237/g.46585  ORF Transcript_31237/g.46585 Transcript_31237/m.46585 type:complete len:102 (+) Transcript_31237:901-1206(+)
MAQVVVGGQYLDGTEGIFLRGDDKDVNFGYGTTNAITLVLNEEEDAAAMRYIAVRSGALWHGWFNFLIFCILLCVSFWERCGILPPPHFSFCVCTFCVQSL